MLPLEEIYSLFVYPKNGFVLYKKPIVAFAYFKGLKIDLISGRRIQCNFEDIKSSLKNIRADKKSNRPIVMHTFFELGYLFQDLDHLVSDNQLLAIEIHYEQFQIMKSLPEAKPIHLKKISGPTKKSYKEKFEYIYDNLQAGNCYQVNLTSPYYFELPKNCNSYHLVAKLWQDPSKIGGHAHMTQIPFLRKVFFSNSPECLFRLDNSKEESLLSTMPIKGSVAFNRKSDSFAQAWSLLNQNPKESAELNMITDLMRNDLAKIQAPRAKVSQKKAPLLVPEILHQYSLIEVPLRKPFTILDVLSPLFPGGSVTGAPKRRVLEIIHYIEKYQRGFYCGSTTLIHEKLCQASINIRSSEIDLNSETLKYPAGGGITLLSDVESEYSEMQLKVHSFLTLFST